MTRKGMISPRDLAPQTAFEIPQQIFLEAPSLESYDALGPLFLTCNRSKYALSGSCTDPIRASSRQLTRVCKKMNEWMFSRS